MNVNPDEQIKRSMQAIVLPRGDRAVSLVYRGVRLGDCGLTEVRKLYAALHAAAVEKYGASTKAVLAECMENIRTTSLEDVACLIRRLDVSGRSVLKLLVLVSWLKLSIRFESAAALAYNTVFLDGEPNPTVGQVVPAVISGILPDSHCTAAKAYSRLVRRCRVINYRIYNGDGKSDVKNTTLIPSTVFKGVGSPVWGETQRPEETHPQGVMSTPVTPLPSDSRIDVSIDIDAVMAHTSVLNTARVLKGSLVVKVSPQPISMLRTNYQVWLDRASRLVDVKKCVAIRFGTIVSLVGILNLHLVYDAELDSELNAYELTAKVARYIEDWKSDAFSDEPQVDAGESRGNKEDTLYPYDLEAFFNGLHRVTCSTNIFVFICVFGNKKSATDSLGAYKNIVARLGESLRLDLLPSLRVDVCVNVNAPRESVVLANNNFFKALGRSPSHRLFFCNDFINVNARTDTFDASSNRLRYQQTCYQKINCYSSIEDLIADERQCTFLPRFAGASLKADLYRKSTFGNRTAVSNIQQRYAKLGKVEAKFKTKQINYRIEVTACLFQIDEVLQYLLSLVEPCNFSVIDFPEFANVFRACVQRFATPITCLTRLNDRTTFTDILNSTVAEIIFIEMYLKGGCNMHMLGTPARTVAAEVACYSTGRFAVPPITEALQAFASAIDSSKDLVLRKVVDAMPAISDDIKQFFNLLLDIYTSSDPCSAFVSLYFKLSSSYAINSYSALASSVARGSPVCRQVLFDRWSNDVVLATKSTKVHCGPLALAFAVLDEKFGFCEATTVAALRAAMIDAGVGHVYHKAPVFNAQVLVPSSDVCRILYGFTQQAAYTEALAEAAAHRDDVATRMGPASEAEFIRILVGLYLFRYSSCAIKELLDCPLFGFFYARNLAWIKNQRSTLADKLIKRRYNLSLLLSRARSWTPGGFPLADVLEYMARCGVVLHSPGRDAFEKLYLLEVIRYEVLLCESNIEVATDEEILKTLLPADKANLVLRQLAKQLGSGLSGVDVETTDDHLGCAAVPSREIQLQLEVADLRNEVKDLRGLLEEFKQYVIPRLSPPAPVTGRAAGVVDVHEATALDSLLADDVELTTIDTFERSDKVPADASDGVNDNEPLMADSCESAEVKLYARLISNYKEKNVLEFSVGMVRARLYDAKGRIKHDQLIAMLNTLVEHGLLYKVASDGENPRRARYSFIA